MTLKEFLIILGIVSLTFFVLLIDLVLANQGRLQDRMQGGNNHRIDLIGRPSECN